MKNKYTFKIATFALAAVASFSSIAQSNKVISGTDNRLVNDVNLNTTKQKISNDKGITTCGTDTSNYPLRKASGLAFLGLNNATSATAVAQYYDAPDSLTVNGFDFAAFMSDTSAGGIDTINIQVQLWLAGADSLPTGSPLVNETITIDTNFYNGSLALLTKSAVFSTPVKVGQPYLLVVSNNSPVPISVISNSFAAGNGFGEYLANAQIGANWIRSYNVNIGTSNLNADFLFHPYVDYDLITDFTLSPPFITSAPVSVGVLNNSSAITGVRMYNLNTPIFGNPLSTNHTYDYGNGGGAVNVVDSNVTFQMLQDYTITLNDTIRQLNGNVCAGAETKTLKAIVPSDIVITEINYNGAESGTDTSEFIEFYNNTNATVNLDGWSFVQGVSHTFGPNDSIQPSQYAVIAFDSSAFRNRYGFDANFVWNSGGLSNGGEDITITNSVGMTIDSVDYDDGGVWPSGSAAGQADGGGASIELQVINSDNNDGANWNASTTAVPGQIINGFQVYGTPGQPLLVGLKKFEIAKDGFAFYPNPANNQITIELEDNSSKNNNLFILSLDGKIVLERVMTSKKETLNLDNLSQGVYFVRINETLKKLIVTK